MKKYNSKKIALALIAIVIAISGIVIFNLACKKEEPAPTPTSTTTGQPGTRATTDSSGTMGTEGTMTPQSISANLIFEETMEGATPFSTAYDAKSDLATSYSLTYVTSPVYQGSKSARFELRDTDPLVSNSRRAEVTVVKGNITKDTWYSFASYYPSVGYEYDNMQEVNCQWYQSGSPATAFRTKADRFLLLTGNVLSPDNRKEIDLGPITKDKWHLWVFHFIHSYGSDGLIEVWHDGAKVLTHTGGNMYNDVLPKWKLGVYKSSFKDGGSSVHKRIIYYDNVRVGNSSATYSDMTGGVAGTTTGTTTTGTTTTGTTTTGTTTTGTTTTGTTTTGTTTGTTTTNTISGTTTGTTTSTAITAPSTGNKVASFTLINAETDKPIGTITEGATISLSAIGTQKINIRADIASGATVGSILFNLTGAQSKARTDSAVPYAALGDDGTGNYYSWIPVVGKYTLKATPYTGSGASGTATTATTLNFTVTQ